MGALADNLAVFESSTYWTATAKLGKGYGVAYAAEAAAVADWLTRLDADPTLVSVPPAVSTRHGQGLVGMIQAAVRLQVPPPAPTGTTPRLGLFHEGSVLPGTFRHLDKYALVVVSADGVAGAKQYCAGALKLLYSNCASVVTGYTEGLSYATAKANGWLLGTPNGSRYVVDHTIPACNTAEAQAVLAYVRTNGMDGCFLDDTIPINPYGVATPPGYRDGVVAYVQLLRDLLRQNGLKLYCNANAYADPTLGNPNDGQGDIAWAKMLAPDGIIEENWVQARDATLGILRARGPAWNQDWDPWQQVPAAIQAAGMQFVGLTYNPTASDASHAYGCASLLLQDAGKAVFCGANVDNSDPWGPWADSATALGAAAAPPVGPTSGLTRPSRAYAGGAVTVDPVAVAATL